MRVKLITTQYVENDRLTKMIEEFLAKGEGTEKIYKAIKTFISEDPDLCHFIPEDLHDRTSMSIDRSLFKKEEQVFVYFDYNTCAWTMRTKDGYYLTACDRISAILRTCNYKKNKYVPNIEKALLKIKKGNTHGLWELWIINHIDGRKQVIKRFKTEDSANKEVEKRFGYNGQKYWEEYCG